MKKFIVASLVGLMLLGLTGCDAEGAEIAGNLYDALKEAGEYVYDEVDSAVKEYEQNGTTNTDDDFYDSEDEYTQEDLFKDTIKDYSKRYTMYGNEILGLMSGIKQSGLTLLIERKGAESAYVIGKAVTYDGTEYVEGINELDSTYYDFCGINGIIKKSISSMTTRKFVVYQYEDYILDVNEFEDLGTSNEFDVLTLVNEKGSIVGFYFYER